MERLSLWVSWGCFWVACWLMLWIISVRDSFRVVILVLLLWGLFEDGLEGCFCFSGVVFC